MSNVTLVKGTLWTGTTGRELRRMGHAHQVVAAYLITAPGGSLYGLYRLPLIVLSEHTATTIEQAHAILRSLADLQFAFYADEWVWLPTMAMRQIAGDDVLSVTDRRVLGLHGWYAALPENPFLGAFYDYYHATFYMPKRREGTMANVQIGTRQDALFELAPPKTSALNRSVYEICERTFAWWWKHYPGRRKIGKQEAFRKWLQVRPVMDEHRTARAIQVLEHQKRSADWLESNGRYIPHPKTYINQGRMFDEVDERRLPSLSPDDAENFTALSNWEPPEE